MRSANGRSNFLASVKPSIAGLRHNLLQHARLNHSAVFLAGAALCMLLLGCHRMRLTEPIALQDDHIFMLVQTKHLIDRRMEPLQPGSRIP
jgi:hypothetical protein